MKNNLFHKPEYSIRKPFLPVCFLLFGLFLAGKAEAANPLELQMNDPLFQVSNAAPGESFSSPVTLLNHGDHRETFQFEIDVKTNPEKLAEHLFFKVADGNGNCLYGCGGNVSLAYLDRREPDIAKVSPHSTTYYNFILTFDPDAGNEFQDTETSFDMKLGFEGTVTRRHRRGGNGGGGNGGTNTNPQGLVGGAATSLAGVISGGGQDQGGENFPSGEVQGEENPGPGEVAGASTETCHGWPFWVWVLALVAYFSAFLWRTFDRIKVQVEKRKIRWKWQAGFAAAAIAFWYFFDKCREYAWFAILAAVGGAAVYLSYLYLFRKDIRKITDAGKG